MIRIASETELLDSFRALDRDEVELPDDLSFPVLVKDYLTWSDPGGHRVYLVFSEPGADSRKRSALGIVFRRSASGSGPPQMCEWCHAVRGGDGVMLLTATASSQKRVGIHLCRDLSCKDKVEAAPGAHDFPESLSARDRTQRILQRMSQFARRAIF
jgi:hypothetical protein